MFGEIVRDEYAVQWTSPPDIAGSYSLIAGSREDAERDLKAHTDRAGRLVRRTVTYSTYIPVEEEPVTEDAKPERLEHAAHRYLFRPGGRNSWNIYVDRPDMSDDLFVGVVFDEETAKFVARALNHYTGVEELTNTDLNDLGANLPRAMRTER